MFKDLKKQPTKQKKSHNQKPNLLLVKSMSGATNFPWPELNQVF